MTSHFAPVSVWISGREEKNLQAAVPSPSQHPSSTLEGADNSLFVPSQC